VKSKIIRIGNSRGVRISKALLEQARLESEVEITVQGNRLIITSVTAPRVGWEEAFRAMAASGDDGLLDPDVFQESDWDVREWSW
jgi:antitoxin MazE